MTCIVGIVDDFGSVFMGGDSAACGDCSIQTIKDGKVFQKENFLFGIAGNPRLYAILKYNFDLPMDDYDNPLLYLNSYFVPALRECLADNGFLEIKDEIESTPETWVLMGYKGRLFMLDSSFFVSEYDQPFASIGCGSDIALGCMYLMEKIRGDGLMPEAKIELALGASEEFNCHVRRPFTILKLEEK